MQCVLDVCADDTGPYVTRLSVVRYPVFINCQVDLLGSQLQLFLPNGSTPVFALLRTWTFLQIHCGVWISFTSYTSPNTPPRQDHFSDYSSVTFTCSSPT